MNNLQENLHERLRKFFDIFGAYCEQYSINYSIVADESNKQGYLVLGVNNQQISDMRQYFDQVARRHDLVMDLSKHKNGWLFEFALDTIAEAGYWRTTGAPYAMKGQPKRKKKEDYSPFSRPEDTKKVRAGKIPIQQSGNKEAAKATFEDQYKSPTGKHRRDQSMWPSSFGPSKTYGGISTKAKGKGKTKKESDANLRPIGLFGPADKSKPEGTHPSPGARFVKQYGERNPRNESVDESYQEDDVYIVIQRIALDCGLTAQPFLFVDPDGRRFARLTEGRLLIDAYRSGIGSVVIEIYDGIRKIYNSEFNVKIGDYLRNENELQAAVAAVCGSE